MVDESRLVHVDLGVVVEKKLPKQDNPKKLFGLVSDSAFSEHVGNFQEALDYSEVDKLVELLNDLQKLELMVLKKMEIICLILIDQLGK